MSSLPQNLFLPLYELHHHYALYCNIHGISEQYRLKQYFNISAFVIQKDHCTIYHRVYVMLCWHNRMSQMQYHWSITLGQRCPWVGTFLTVWSHLQFVIWDGALSMAISVHRETPLVKCHVASVYQKEVPSLTFKIILCVF